jgi:tetratricopeptide (TPR) repeat protein
MRVAFEHLAHAHDLFHECRDPFGMMIALNGLGAAACELGRFTEARNYFRAAIDLCQRYGESRNLSYQLGNLALTLGTIGEYVEALAQSQRAQDLAVERQLETALVSILIARGGLLATLGLEAEARAALDSLKLDNLREFNLGQRELVLAQLELQSQRPCHADAHLTRAEQFLHACGAEDELVIHDLLKARCEWMMDRRADAVVRLRRACDAADSMHLRLTRCQLDATLGELLAEVDAPEASGHAQAGLEAAHGMGVVEIEWRCERALGLIASRHRDWTAAREFYQRCIAILRELTVAMPAEMAGAYLAVPERRRVFHEIRTLAAQSSS